MAPHLPACLPPWPLVLLFASAPLVPQRLTCLQRVWIPLACGHKRRRGPCVMREGSIGPCPALGASSAACFALGPHWPHLASCVGCCVAASCDTWIMNGSYMALYTILCGLLCCGIM